MKGKGRNNHFHQPKSTPFSDKQLEGLVISHLGKGLAVESPSGQIILCQTRRRLGDVAVGDRVMWSPSQNGDQGRVEEILVRSSVLIRPGYAEKLRVVAANLDRVFIVIAPAPEPDWLLVDQFLAVCEFRQINAEIVCNKIDLLENEAPLLSVLAEYARIGYPYHAVSARLGRGLTELKLALKGHCSMLAGQSGVGKSSLTKALLPDKNFRIGEISERSGLGRHTTTAATLYHLLDGGDLIDSPGVSVFGLAEIKGEELGWGYREFHRLIPKCQFNDCRHVNDKGCAIREAVENSDILPVRYQRYLKLLDKLTQTAII